MQLQFLCKAYERIADHFFKAKSARDESCEMFLFFLCDAYLPALKSCDVLILIFKSLCNLVTYSRVASPINYF